MGGLFGKKVENWGVFFVKSGPYLNAGCIMCSISIFYFTFYLFAWGGVRPHPTHPPPPASGPGFGAAPANLDPAAASADVAADGDEEDH